METVIQEVREVTREELEYNDLVGHFKINEPIRERVLTQNTILRHYGIDQFDIN